MKMPVTIRLLALIVIGAIIVATVVLLPIREYLSQFLESVEQLGIWGPVLVIAFYVVACVLFIPGSLVTQGVGFLYGVVWGTVSVTTSARRWNAIGPLRTTWINQMVVLGYYLGVVPERLARWYRRGEGGRP